jgi:hypothetical protein
MTISSVCEKEAMLMSGVEKVMGMWDHLVWIMRPSITM